MSRRDLHIEIASRMAGADIFRAEEIFQELEEARPTADYSDHMVDAMRYTFMVRPVKLNRWQRILGWVKTKLAKFKKLWV